jgi:hypothetical protein
MLQGNCKNSAGLGADHAETEIIDARIDANASNAAIDHET